MCHGVCAPSGKKKSHCKYAVKIKWKWKINHTQRAREYSNESQNRNNDERFKCSSTGELMVTIKD